MNDPAAPPVDPVAASEAEGSRRRAIPAWIISIVVHAVMLLVLSLVIYATTEAVDEPALRTTAVPPPPPAPIDRQERTLEEEKIPLEIEEVADVVKPSPISELDVAVDEIQREEEVESDTPKGREEAVADSEMGGSGSFMAIGAGGGGSGMFGSRSGGGKKRALGRFGGNQASENAVDAALRWFKKHQSADGMWDVDAYQLNCNETPKCEPGGGWPGDATMEQADVACTAYAVLCFLGAGYEHRMPSKYRATVKKGLDWLMAAQKPDGLLGERNYEHAIATMALAEAYAMTNDPALRGPTTKGVRVILDRQAKGKDGYPLAWDYTKPNPQRLDASVSGWNVMALKSAAAGGIDIEQGMEGAKRWLELCWKDHNKGWEKLDPYGTSWFPYTWSAEGELQGFKAPKRDLSCVAALCAVFLGHRSGDLMLETLANHIVATQMPKSYPCNTYFMYYNTLAIFQVGGPRWQQWNESVRDILVKAQRRSTDCFDGSWDYKGTEFVGYEVGRLLSTAYCCLSLQVYYRYLPVAVKGKR